MKNCTNVLKLVEAVQIIIVVQIICNRQAVQVEVLFRVIERFVEHFQGEAIDLVVGVESRGFIIGAPLALRLGSEPLESPIFTLVNFEGE